MYAITINNRHFTVTTEELKKLQARKIVFCYEIKL